MAGLLEFDGRRRHRAGGGWVDRVAGASFLHGRRPQRSHKAC